MIPDVYKKNVFTNMIHFIYSANAKRDMGKKENEISNNHNVFVLSHKKLCLHGCKLNTMMSYIHKINIYQE